MIDGHCHISAAEFDQDRDAILEEARNVGVKGIVAVCEFPGDFQKVLDLSSKYEDFIYPCLGVHPVQWGNKSVTLKEFAEAEEWIMKHSKILYGIGEIGLDFTPRYIKSPDDKEIQREVFTKQIKLAQELDLPVYSAITLVVWCQFDIPGKMLNSASGKEWKASLCNLLSLQNVTIAVHLEINVERNVHSRSAGRPVIDLLVQQGAQKVLLHAFDGKPSVAMRGVEAGFFFSVPPSIVRSEQKQKLVKQIPLSNLLLETDAPALGPEKQERNVPKNISISCQEIARIKGITTENVTEQTSVNAYKLFSRIIHRLPKV